MKKTEKWKPGGRLRQKSDTKKWLLNWRESIGGKDAEEFETPLVVPRCRKKGK